MRTGGIAAALARELTVTLVEPFWGAQEAPPDGGAPPGIERIALPGAERPGVIGHFADLRPRLGLDAIDAAGRRRLRRIVEEKAPRVVLYGQSYVAAAAPPVSMPWIVDFQNVEAQRLRSIAAASRGIHRASALWECVKAQLWERRVARQCAFALAVSPDDAAVISKWGAEVVTVPNVPPAVEPCGRSPDRGTVLFVANVRYEPNEQAAVRLIERVWPQVRARVADAELHVIGTGTDDRLARLSRDGVRIGGQVADLRPHYDAAALVVAPVESGGGTQLKVVEALAYGRVVVGSPYSARSAPAQAESGVVVADDEAGLATSIVEVLTDVAARHRREAELVAAMAETRGWDLACRPVLERLRPLLDR